MANDRDDRIVWLDMEMTGLDPEQDRILEVAVLVTDGQLRLVAEGPDLVLHQSDALLAGMDDWNRRHHSRSGLVDKVKASTLDEAAAEAEILAFLREHCTPGKAPLAGNSIHQDRRFIRKGMPQLDTFLHYRMIDVSSIKELVKRWMPEVYQAAPGKNDVHRALDDIRESLAELAHYRAHAFRPHPGSDGTLAGSDAADRGSAPETPDPSPSPGAPPRGGPDPA
ncbi:MAG TPA: oligoribonuclease [Polyangiaceae bacterium LLY-WYZ-14_1]|nr:oligoribonuclease [Polyangiaceae bacterium LLY-WYZ-14_1]